ncbi:MAG: ATP-binding protein [Sphingomonadaceae bacterium]|nr:ATP-binding protein [Sphingomonadaceae bacterium]
MALIGISVLLGAGGFALDRALTSYLRAQFDEGLGATLTALVGNAEVGPDGRVRFTRALADQRYFEPYSGFYWQVLTPGDDPFPSRSLWDRRLGPGLPEPAIEPRAYDYAEGPYRADPVRVMERDAVLPGSGKAFRFQVAQSTRALEAQIAKLRRILAWSLGGLGLGLFLIAMGQSSFGLRPLKRLRQSIAAIRGGTLARVPADVPPEVVPLVDELNELLAHNASQAEEARTHAGNLAHALKTPMSILLNEARAEDSDFARTVEAQVAVMHRFVDHHLARARAVGRRAASTARTPLWPALDAVARTVERMHAAREPVIDLAGDKTLEFRGERQDLEEMLGNLLENAAKYGGGRVFVTVEKAEGAARLLIEDDGPGIPASRRAELFQRGARLDTEKPGTGLGLAISRDIAEIYGGSVELGESEDLGGLLVTLTLPIAEQTAAAPSRSAALPRAAA